MVWHIIPKQIILTLGYTGVFEYNEQTLEREKEYNRPKYPGYSAIGYDYEYDLYIGRANHRIFFADTKIWENYMNMEFLCLKLLKI